MKNFERYSLIITFLMMCIALFALIVQAGDWLFPRSPVIPTPIDFDVPTQSEMESIPLESTIQPQVLSMCSGNDWANCWEVNDTEKFIRWIGIQDTNADIGQSNSILDKLKSGYIAIFTIDSDMIINICTGTINGKFVSGSCPIAIELPPGTYQVSSSGESGGFRVTQDGSQ